MPLQVTDLDRKIVAALKREGVLSTTALADAIEEERGPVYRRCKALEKNKILRSQEKKRRLLFSQVTGEVITSENRDEIRGVERQLDRVVWAHAKKRQRLTEKQKREIRSGLEKKLRQLGAPKERRERVKERLGEELKECYGSHAKRAYGTGSFRSPARYWALAGDADEPFE